MSIPILILGGLAIVLVGVTMGATKSPSGKLPTAREFAKVKALAQKWGAQFSVPTSIILTLAHIESSFRPTVFNTNERAMSVGGAYGVVAMSLQTAAGLVAQIRSKGLDKKHAAIAETLKRWNNAATVATVKSLIAAKKHSELVALGQPLLDPDLCLLLSVYMLSGLWVKYKGDPQKVGSAYHSGSKPVDEAIKAGVPVTSKLGPAGREYYARVTNVFPEYKGVA